MLRLGSHPIHTWMTVCRCVAFTLTGPGRGRLDKCGWTFAVSFQSRFEGENDWHALHSRSVRVAEWLTNPEPDEAKEKHPITSWITGSR